MNGVRVSVSPGFLLLLALLFYLDGGLFLPGILACALHELGHVAGIRLMGGRVRWLRLALVGAELGLDPARPLSYRGEVTAALCGPLCNLLCCAAGGLCGLFLFAGISLSLGLFNLLPVGALDGGRCLFFLTAAFWGESAAGRVLRASSLLVSAAALAAGFYLCVRLENPTLLFSALWLCAGCLPLDGAKKKHLAFSPLSW